MKGSVDGMFISLFLLSISGCMNNDLFMFLFLVFDILQESDNITVGF